MQTETEAKKEVGAGECIAAISSQKLRRVSKWDDSADASGVGKCGNSRMDDVVFLRDPWRVDHGSGGRAMTMSDEVDQEAAGEISKFYNDKANEDKEIATTTDREDGAPAVTKDLLVGPGRPPRTTTPPG